jgi:hypothetical protein
VSEGEALLDLAYRLTVLKDRYGGQDQSPCLAGNARSVESSRQASEAEAGLAKVLKTTMDHFKSSRRRTGVAHGTLRVKREE